MEDFFRFCGLLRKAKLYKTATQTPKVHSVQGGVIELLNRHKYTKIGAL